MDIYADLLKGTNDKFLKEIFPLLEKHDLLVHGKIIDDSFPKILDRWQLQKQSIHEKTIALRDHMAKVETIDGFSTVILKDLIFLMAQVSLGFFEIMTKFLSYSIDLEKIKYGERPAMYGDIVNKLGDYQSDGKLVFSKGGLEKFFSVELRNSLARDRWWLNHNGEFTFREEEGTEISLSIGEQYEALAQINAIVQSFLENYLAKFNQPLLDQLKSERPELFDYKNP